MVYKKEPPEWEAPFSMVVVIARGYAADRRQSDCLSASDHGETLREVNPGNPHSRDASADPPTPFFASIPGDYISSATSFSVSTTSCGYACSTFSASAIALLLSSSISASMSVPAIVSYASSVSAAGT